MARKPIAQQLAESSAMIGARDKAMQTPDEVRKAFLARRKNVGPVFVEPFSIGILWLFEELKHPLNEGRKPMLDGGGNPVLGAGGNPRFEPLSIRDTARAIYIFHDSEAAAETLDEGMEAFDAAAMSLMRGIPVQDVSRINAAISEAFTEGLATLPGAGGSNPRETGS